jgi:hypothetical protein
MGARHARERRHERLRMAAFLGPIIIGTIAGSLLFGGDGVEEGLSAGQAICAFLGYVMGMMATTLVENPNRPAKEVAAAGGKMALVMLAGGVTVMWPILLLMGIGWIVGLFI